jgi:hypothetical protein
MHCPGARSLHIEADHSVPISHRHGVTFRESNDTGFAAHLDVDTTCRSRRHNRDLIPRSDRVGQLAEPDDWRSDTSPGSRKEGRVQCGLKPVAIRCHFYAHW